MLNAKWPPQTFSNMINIFISKVGNNKRDEDSTVKKMDRLKKISSMMKEVPDADEENVT